MSILDKIAARPRLSDDEWAKLEFGATLGEHVCNCGAKLAMEHQRNRNAPTCEVCERPWTRRCHGWHGTDGGHTCEGDGWMRPHRVAGPDTPWMPSECLACTVAPQRAHRMAQVPQVFAGLEDELALATDGGYQHLDHRQALEQALGQWSRKGLLVWGPCGSGKSVSVLRWAVMQYLAGASVVWVRSRQLVRVHKRFGDRDEGAALLRRVTRARVLVIDEFQAAGATDWTSNVAAEMNYLIQDRLDGGGLRTVLITNRTPEQVLTPADDGGGLSEMVLSRWQSAGRVVECTGHDMRGRAN